jgi:lipoteichoic acid synthase
MLYGNMGSFWNRNDMYPGLGYDYFFDAEDFYVTEENSADYGLKDCNHDEKAILTRTLTFLKGLLSEFGI